MIPTELISKVLARQCVLFAGAGLTHDGGGVLWNELIDYLKKEFDYSSPLRDNFKIMQHLCDIHTPKVVYGKVAQKLQNVNIVGNKNKLTSLPWFSVFTTNYDDALEKSLRRNNPNVDIITVYKGTEYVLTGKSSELYCIKLMGSSSVEFGKPGSMVLTQGELQKANEERGLIYSELVAHAAKLSFLFVGYSFRDDLFLNILGRLKTDLGMASQNYYAVFKEEPNEEEKFYLESQGVKIIYSDLDLFSEELITNINLLSPDDYTQLKIQMGQNIVPIDERNIGNFFVDYNPITFNDFSREAIGYNFFKGDLNSLLPFAKKWYFPRQEIDDVIKSVRSFSNKESTKNIIRVNGNLGAGRSFIILASVCNLILDHYSIAVQIPQYAYNPIPNMDDLHCFVAEVKRSVENLAIHPPNQIIFYALFEPDQRILHEFKQIAEMSEIPAILIYEGCEYQDSLEDCPPSEEFVHINVRDELLPEQQTQLATYIERITKILRLPEITQDQIWELIVEEKHFLPIMYRLIDPSRKSIQRIIEERFTELIDEPLNIDCVAFCSLSTCFNLEMPLSVFRKAISYRGSYGFCYDEIFNLLEKCKEFVKISYYRDNYFISIYHPLIADYLVKKIRLDNMNQYLLNVADTVDLRIKSEADYARKLLIDNGVNNETSSHRCFTKQGLQEALVLIKDRCPARPILHHFARYLFKQNKNDEQIIPLLELALREPQEKYALAERVENVYTTLAHIRWILNMDQILKNPNGNKELGIIFDYLNRAQQSVEINLHPYVVHARILHDLWKNAPNIVDASNILTSFFDVVNSGLAISDEDPYGKYKLQDMYFQVIYSIDKKEAVSLAKSLFEHEDDGTGYYILARKEYDQYHDTNMALEYLDQAIQAEKFPQMSIAFKIEIVLNDPSKSPNYGELVLLVDQISSEYGFKDTWKTAYYKAVIYAIEGYKSPSIRHFILSHRLAPKTLQSKVLLFWMENGHRKVITGIVASDMTRSEGRIYNHHLKGVDGDIYFNPSAQPELRRIKSGLTVDFELGFSPRGPIAFDLRPSRLR